MDKAKEVLVSALRQYRHNDGSGLIVAYDKEDTEKVVNTLLEELENYESNELTKEGE